MSGSDPSLFPGLRSSDTGPAEALNPEAPLAERMRPLQIDEIVGQEHLLGPDGFLRRLLTGGRMVSMLLWGPPGSGKTTLARLLADSHSVTFVELSATSAGVKQVREVLEQARRRTRAAAGDTLLFLDEIHRFHKGQQEALLPAVESGAITLIGATTENPSFELVGPLLSRCRVVRLEPLEPHHIAQLLQRALATPAPRGLGGVAPPVDPEAIEWLAAAVAGDARKALNVAELAVQLCTAAERARVTLKTLQQALQERVAGHGREEHYDQLSALHKSLRNSDADAAMYWLVCLLEAGEAPETVARRIIRAASEDVGLADPGALQVAMAGFAAVQALGLPEGALALAEAALYVALAPKSDALYRGYQTAQAQVRDSGPDPVPLRLRNAVTALMKQHGYGSGYQHAHEADRGVTSMCCLPDRLAGSSFYRPTRRGLEARLRERLEQIRRAKQEQEAGPPASEPPSR